MLKKATWFHSPIAALAAAELCSHQVARLAGHVGGKGDPGYRLVDRPSHCFLQDEDPSTATQETSRSRLSSLPVAVAAAVAFAAGENASVENRWCQLGDIVQSTALTILGRACYQHRDWFDDNDAVITNLFVEKNRLHRAYLDRPTDANRSAFYQCHRVAQQRPEGSQKIEKTVASSADSEPGPDDNYDTLTFGSIRVTEAIHVRIASSGSSEQHTGELSAASKRCSQPGITTFGEKGATEATSLAEAGVAVQASEPRSPPPQSTFLQSTSNDIEEIKRILKDMQCKLEQMEFPRDGTSTPAHGQCCAPKRKGLSTRQLDLFAFAVSWIACLQGIVAAVVTAVFWNRGSKYYPHLPDRLCELALTLIIIEALLAILAFCGCWSVRKKSPIMMTLVAAANSILILIQFGTLGWTFSHTPKASHLCVFMDYIINVEPHCQQGRLLPVFRLKTIASDSLATHSADSKEDAFIE
ncbi:hypothetical protein SprV_0200708200 [Sparganum proliferum]